MASLVKKAVLEIQLKVEVAQSVDVRPGQNGETGVNAQLPAMVDQEKDLGFALMVVQVKRDATVQ